MNFDYAIFTEQWAHLYKPMRHEYGRDASNKRFFVCDSYNHMTDFMRQMDPETSPCVIIESQQEGDVQEGFDHPRYSFYFMVRAREMADGYEAIAAKRDAKEIMLDFVNFVRVFKEAVDREEQISQLPLESGTYLDQLRTAVLDGDRCMDSIDIESFTYQSLNEIYDGWYGIVIDISDTQVYDLCIDLSQYTE